MNEKPTDSVQETLEFLDAMSDVEPLHNDKVYHNTPKPPAIPIKTIEDEQQVLVDRLSDEYEPLGNIQLGDILSYCQPGIQSKVFRKLRSGRYRISDELDLHGMNVKQAKEILLLYLQQVKQLERCCVRIIHGKGKRSSNKGPILKRKVDLWLQCHGRVLAYHSALPCDGGTGAVYVLLKRQY